MSSKQPLGRPGLLWMCRAVLRMGAGGSQDLCSLAGAAWTINGCGAHSLEAHVAGLL